MEHEPCNCVEVVRLLLSVATPKLHPSFSGWHPETRANAERLGLTLPSYGHVYAVHGGIMNLRAAAGHDEGAVLRHRIEALLRVMPLPDISSRGFGPEARRQAKALGFSLPCKNAITRYAPDMWERLRAAWDAHLETERCRALRETLIAFRSATGRYPDRMCANPQPGTNSPPGRNGWDVRDLAVAKALDIEIVSAPTYMRHFGTMPRAFRLAEIERRRRLDPTAELRFVAVKMQKEEAPRIFAEIARRVVIRWGENGGWHHEVEAVADQLGVNLPSMGTIHRWFGGIAGLRRAAGISNIPSRTRPPNWRREEAEAVMQRLATVVATRLDKGGKRWRPEVYAAASDLGLNVPCPASLNRLGLSHLYRLKPA